MKKMIVVAAMMMLGTIAVSAQDAENTEVIKTDAQQVPVCYVNKTLDELRQGVGELETILESEK